MAHAYHRTLIARLGFADRDRQLPEHDLACQYLARAEVMQAILRRYLPQPEQSLVPKFGAPERVYGLYTQVLAPTFSAPRFEVPIPRGRPPSGSVVGFLDLVLSGEVEVVYEERERSTEQISYGPQPMSVSPRVLIEVKITPTNVSEILRQLQFYRQHLDPAGERYVWVAVTRFPISVEDKAMLSGAGIGHLRLGARFEAYRQHLRSRARSMADSPEI